MTVHQITLSLPEPLYLRLERTAQATRRPLADVLLRAVEVGSPPDWEDAPSEFQADLATLDRLDDDTLWLIARSRQTEQDMTRYPMCDFLGGNEVVKIKRRTTKQKIDENTNGVSEHLADQAILVMPQVMSVSGFDVESLGQV
jgi:hypothetical protein